MLIRSNLQPGDIGYVIYLHGTLYQEEYRLDHTFEGYVASGLGDFALSYDPANDYFAVAEMDGLIVGSIAIVAKPERTAQLRWFLVHPKSRGMGLGQKLIEGALSFCRSREFVSVYLWTISELETASHLYRKVGFTLTEQSTHEIWGALRTEERYDLVLASAR
jgi:N-acetylglutamate synthase-like GNAT family acetyltransferase